MRQIIIEVPETFINKTLKDPMKRDWLENVFKSYNIEDKEKDYCFRRLNKSTAYLEVSLV